MHSERVRRGPQAACRLVEGLQEIENHRVRRGTMYHLQALWDSCGRVPRVLPVQFLGGKVNMSDLISRQDAIRLAEQGQIQGFEWQFKKLCELPSAQPDIIRCGECIYYDPPHVEKEDARYEYSEMPKEAFDVLGTGLVSMEYGINIGGRCCVDYYCKSYSDDKRVYVREDNYCGRAERRTDG